MTRAIPYQCCHCHCPDDSDHHRPGLHTDRPRCQKGELGEEESRQLRRQSHLFSVFLPSPFAHRHHHHHHRSSGKLGSPLLLRSPLLLQPASPSDGTMLLAPRPRPPRSPLPSPQAPSALGPSAAFSPVNQVVRCCPLARAAGRLRANVLSPASASAYKLKTSGIPR